MLRIRKQPKTLNMKPSPWLLPDNKQHIHGRYGQGMDEAAVCLFYAWLMQEYPDTYFTEYELAKRLDVHRCVVDEWLMALSYKSLLIERGIHNSRGSIRTFTPDTKRQFFAKNITNSFIKIIPCSSFDPWTDRSSDELSSNCWTPYYLDDIINKYYSVFSDEVFILTGKRRIRKGKVFHRLINSRSDNDHPIHFKNSFKKKTCQENGRPKPPNLARKKEVEKLCFAQGSLIRKRGEKPRELLSRLPSKYFDNIDAEREEVLGHLDKKQAPIKKTLGKRGKKLK